MNIQEAYNKGLTDAENKIISEFRKIIVLDDDNYESFANPDVEALRLAFADWSKYLHCHSDGKTMKGKRVQVLLTKTKQLISK
jgi:hypothetical protein